MGFLSRRRKWLPRAIFADHDLLAGDAARGAVKWQARQPLSARLSGVDGASHRRFKVLGQPRI
jgi:hypothetical protein